MANGDPPTSINSIESLRDVVLINGDVRTTEFGPEKYCPHGLCWSYVLSSSGLRDPLPPSEHKFP
jgi:hypothetical protein